MDYSLRINLMVLDSMIFHMYVCAYVCKLTNKEEIYKIFSSFHNRLSRSKKECFEDVFKTSLT